jgi:hypothetical protein
MDEQPLPDDLSTIKTSKRSEARVEKRKRELGPEHPDTLVSMNNLGFSYWKQGRWKEAEKLQLHVVESRKRVLGPDNPLTLSTMASLGFAYWDEGQYKEAEDTIVYLDQSIPTLLRS